MTVNDAVNIIKDRSHRGNTAVTTDTITTQIVRALNDARRDMVKNVPLRWLRKTSTFNTVGGTAVYNLPADFLDPMYFRYTYQNADYFPKKVTTEREFYQSVYSSQVANNRPRYYFITGVDGSNLFQVVFFPTPDNVYTINYAYMKDPTQTDMSVSTGTIPDIPAYMHDVLVKGGLYYFLKNFDDPMQSIAKADYDAALVAMNQGEDDEDDDPQFRFDNGRFNYGDPNTSTGIKLI